MINKCYSNGTITIIGNSFAIGGFSGSQTTFLCENCYAQVDVTIYTGEISYVGGFAGLSSMSNINSYSCGKIIVEDGSTAVGGFLGGGGSDGVYLLNCYSAGIVICDGSHVGGFIGEVMDDTPKENISNCAYWTGAFSIAFGYWAIPSTAFPYDEWDQSQPWNYNIGDKFYAYNDCPYFHVSLSSHPPPYWGLSGMITLFEVVNDSSAFGMIVFDSAIAADESNVFYRDEGFAAIRCKILGQYTPADINPPPTYIKMLAEVGGTDESVRTSFYSDTHKVYAQGT